MFVSLESHHLADLDLYCNEATSDVVSFDDDDAINIISHESDDVGSNNNINNNNVPSDLDLDFDSDDESCVLALLNSELDQMQEKQHSLAHLRQTTWLATAREEAINWILKVQAYYSFRPETAYLSVNYLDRFLLSHSLPQDKGWPMQLLAVACVAVAAKMEETRVPLLLDLQMMEPRFLFKPKTVQKMELLVMASLRWRLRSVTPFDFASLFIAKLSSSSSSSSANSSKGGFKFSHIVSCVSDVINRTCLVIDFLEHRPSTIAAAALLWVTHQNVDEQSLSCFHKTMSTEMVQKCYNLMKQQKILQSEEIVAKMAESLPLSPTCVIDHAATQESSKDHVLPVT